MADPVIAAAAATQNPPPSAPQPAAPPAKAKGNAKAAAEMCPYALVVRGPRQGRWRAGQHFGPTDTTLAAGTITVEQAAEIEADGALSVRKL